MRIVSLLPACTEWVAAFGAIPDLIGRSHECDYPPDLSDRPALTYPAVPLDALDSQGIDDSVRKQLHRGLSLFEIDIARLRILRPDLILTQAQCDVCAVPLDQIAAELARAGDPDPEIFSFDPQTLKQVFDQALRLGGRLGRIQQAMQVLANGEMSLQRLHDRIGISRKAPDADRPTVVCIEWMHPVMLSGNWVPDIVALAGGRSVGPTSGMRSTYVDWSDIREADPDLIAVMPCGYSISRTREEFSALSGRDGWRGLSAVRNGRVFLFDGHAYFNRPGPRLYRAVELLAAAIHGHTSLVSPESWEMQRITDAPKSAG